MNKRLLEKYAAIAITAEEYEKAKAILPEDEFAKKYYVGAGYYKIEDMSLQEIQTIILDKILGWVQFFGALTVIGIIAAIILLLT